METVTRQRASISTDRYGKTVRDWRLPTLDLVIEGVAFDPGGSLEPSEVGRESVITQPTLYDPTCADVGPADRILRAGITYEVDGDPAAWRSPFSDWAPGQVIKLKVVQG